MEFFLRNFYNCKLLFTVDDGCEALFKPGNQPTSVYRMVRG